MTRILLACGRLALLPTPFLHQHLLRSLEVIAVLYIGFEPGSAAVINDDLGILNKDQLATGPREKITVFKQP